MDPTVVQPIIDLYDSDGSTNATPFDRDFSGTIEKNNDESISPFERDFSENQSSKKGLLDRVEKGLETYQKKDLSNYQREAAGNAQGARDVLASIQNIAGNPTLGGILPTEEENLSARNKFNEGYGSDPIAGIGRFTGNAVASTPLLMGGEGLLGLAGRGIAEAAPVTAPLVKFFGGGTESNALTNAAGQTIKGATSGNKILRLGSGMTANAGRGIMTQGLLSSQADEGLGNQLISGAETGATLGALGPMAKAGYEALRGKTEIASPYINKLVQSFSRDGALNNIENQLTQAGPEATLADIGGANVRARAGAVAQSPGPGANIAETMLEDRHAGQVDRLTQSALKGLNVDPNQTYEKTLQSLDQQRQQAASPLYKDAYAANKSMQSPELNRILATPAGNAALKDSVRIMQNSRKMVGMSDPELVEQAKLVGSYEPGDGGIAPGLNMETLDHTKKALDSAYARSKSPLHPQGDTSILDVKNDLLAEMDKLDATAKAGPNSTKAEGGSYSQARAAYAGPSQSKAAVDAGYDFMKNGGDISKVSEDDKPFYRVGAANWVRDTLQNTADGANAVRKIFNTPAKRESLKAIFPNQDSYDAFKKTVDNEIQYVKTRNSVLKGSPTVPRAAAMEDLNSNELQGKAGKVKQGVNFINDMAKLSNYGRALYFGGKALDWAGASKPISAEMSEQLGNALFTPEGSREAAKLMTPVSVPKGRQNFLNWYMGHLGVPNAVIGHNLLLAPDQSPQEAQ